MRKLFIGFSIFWILFIIILSLAPINTLLGEFSNKKIFDYDKIIHFLMYLPLGSTLPLIFIKKNKINTTPIYLIILLSVTIFGFLLEWTQTLLSNLERNGSLFDAFANFIGIITGLLIQKYFISIKK